MQIPVGVSQGLNGSLHYDSGRVIAAHGINCHTNSHWISTLGACNPGAALR